MVLPFRLVDEHSLVDLVDEIAKKHWPAVPKVIYQVAGAESNGDAAAFVREWVPNYAEGVKYLLLGLGAGAGLLGGILGYEAGTYLGNHWDVALTLFGGLGGFFGTLLHPPRLVDIAVRLSQAVQEDRFFAVLDLPEPEEEPTRIPLHKAVLATMSGIL